MLALLVLGLGLLAAAGVLVAEAAFTPSRERRAALARAVGDGGPVSLSPQLPSLRERVLAPLVLRLARLALRLGPKTTVEGVRARLLAAGLLRRISPTAFLAGKLVSALAGSLGGVVLGGAAGKPGAGIVLAFVFGFAGLRVPEFVLSKMATARCDEIASELPKAIDLLAVSVEAGLGFDASVAKLVARMEGPLIDELNIMLSEIRIGESRDQALRRLAQRVPAPELASFVRAVVQSELLGISLGRILRTQAAELRNRRQIKAEEKAMKAPVKMLFPTALFIFPAMFIVILAPAVLTLLEVFQ